jgi:hypothetical protein
MHPRRSPAAVPSPLIVLQHHHTIQVIGEEDLGQGGHDINAIIMCMLVIDPSIHLVVVQKLVMDLHLYSSNHPSAFHIVIMMISCTFMCE